jgi:hypothetical protein
MNMDINGLGLIAALTAFLSIWLGHVSVRKVEAHTVHLWKPTLIAIALGLAFEIASLLVASRALSLVFGILGVTLLWDAFEIQRQAQRVRKGHAPANPANPRHASMLAEPDAHAIPFDLLNRDPVGRKVDADEAFELIEVRSK